MKAIRNLLHLLSCSLLSSVFFPLSLSAAPNVAPTVTINSAAMRPGTTLMDVSYRVTDPDDATVKVRALAFKDGVRSFANVIRPVTWAEGTASKLGDAIPTNVDHTLTWDVATDWNIQLGQVKMEVLAVDSNGIIPFNGITIPAAAGKPELKINQVGLTDAQVLNALFWFYASGNPNLELVNGTLQGSTASGVFKQKPVVVGATMAQSYAQPILFKLLNITSADADILAYAEKSTRTQFARDKWLVTSWPYAGTRLIYGGEGQSLPPDLNYSLPITIASGVGWTLALKEDGTVVGWGNNQYRQLDIPVGLSGVTAIAVGERVWEGDTWGYSLALKRDGTVVGWGGDGGGGSWNSTTVIPTGLSGVTAIAAGGCFSLALKNNGTVVGWPSDPNAFHASAVIGMPAGLSGVTAIAAGESFSLALKNNGTVVVWGESPHYQSPYPTPPTGLSGVTAIAAGYDHCLALKSNGTVVAWGGNTYGQITVPAGLSGVIGISAGFKYSLALKNNGTMVAWGRQNDSIPAWFTNVEKIRVGRSGFFAFTAKEL